LLSPGSGRSSGRQRANASTKSQGEQKPFVLPEEPQQDATGADSTSAKPKAEHAQTLEPRKQSHGDESLNAPTEGLAVNPLVSTNQPEAAGSTLTNPVPLTVLNAVGPIGDTMLASGATSDASSNVEALMQETQGASQSLSGLGQAIVDPAAAFAAGPQDAGEAVTGLDAQSQAPATQTAATMTPTARASGEQVSSEALNSQTQQASDLSGGAAATIPASGTATNAAVQTGIALEASEATKATTVSQTPAAGSRVAAEPELEQVSQTGQRSLSEILQRSFESAVSDKSAAGLNSAMPDSAEAIAQAGQTQKTRGVSLPEAARSVEAQTPETNVLAGAWGSVRGNTDAPAAATPVGEQASVDMARPAEQIIENIRQAIQNGQRDLTINLNPPELGRVRMRMYTEGNEIRGRLEVDNPRSFNEIRQQAELLTQRLVGEGIMLRRLDVHLSSAANQTTGFSSPQHDGAGQGEWGQPGTGSDTADHSPNRQLTEVSAAGSARLAAEANIGDSLSGDGLNVWL